MKNVGEKKFYSGIIIGLSLGAIVAGSFGLERSLTAFFMGVFLLFTGYYLYKKSGVDAE